MGQHKRSEGSFGKDCGLLKCVCSNIVQHMGTLFHTDSHYQVVYYILHISATIQACVPAVARLLVMQPIPTLESR